jgi:hypothetical protein
MLNNNLLLLIIAGVVFLVVLQMTSTPATKKAVRRTSDTLKTVSSDVKSSVSSGVAAVKKAEKFSYNDLTETMDNLSIDYNEMEGFQNPKVASESSSPRPESVIKSAKLGNKFGGGDFKTKLKGAGGDVGPNTTNVNGLALASGVPDFTLGVTPVISKEKKAKKLSAKDLLPKESKDDWFDMPYDKKQMMRIENENLLAGASTQSKIGIDTQGQTLKNASWDLRAAPPCPKFNISPWLNSTIEPDYNIKPIM